MISVLCYTVCWKTLLRNDRLFRNLLFSNFGGEIAQWERNHVEPMKVDQIYECALSDSLSDCENHSIDLSTSAAFQFESNRHPLRKSYQNVAVTFLHLDRFSFKSFKRSSRRRFFQRAQKVQWSSSVSLCSNEGKICIQLSEFASFVTQFGH
jgi:hypothetical protein